LIGGEASEDSLAYLRKEREYKNLLLVEQPNGDWARTILRQYLFSQFQYLLFEELQQCSDSQLSAIAAKSIKETAYHLRWSREWVIRLGDGTTESHNRMLNAMDELWRYTGEMFIPAPYETIVDVIKLKAAWEQKVNSVFSEASLIPPSGFPGETKGTNEVLGAMQTGGKEGIHTEHLGFILTDLQYMQRAYPDCKW
jgi:ring-1,2-phenylacetyl-CoA epoxidase subunit PaaC